MRSLGSVRRTALLERLDHLLEVACTVVSAPAGTGKSTLLSNWSEGATVPVTWIDLAPGDDVATALTGPWRPDPGGSWCSTTAAPATS